MEVWKLFSLLVVCTVVRGNPLSLSLEKKNLAHNYKVGVEAREISRFNSLLREEAQRSDNVDVVKLDESGESSAVSLVSPLSYKIGLYLLALTLLSLSYGSWGVGEWNPAKTNMSKNVLEGMLRNPKMTALVLFGFVGIMTAAMKVRGHTAVKEISVVDVPELNANKPPPQLQNNSNFYVPADDQSDNAKLKVEFFGDSEIGDSRPADGERTATKNNEATIPTVVTRKTISELLDNIQMIDQEDDSNYSRTKESTSKFPNLNQVVNNIDNSELRRQDKFAITSAIYQVASKLNGIKGDFDLENFDTTLEKIVPLTYCLSEVGEAVRREAIVYSLVEFSKHVHQLSSIQTYLNTGELNISASDFMSVIRKLAEKDAAAKYCVTNTSISDEMGSIVDKFLGKSDNPGAYVSTCPLIDALEMFASDCTLPSGVDKKELRNEIRHLFLSHLVLETADVYGEHLSRILRFDLHKKIRN